MDKQLLDTDEPHRKVEQARTLLLEYLTEHAAVCPNPEGCLELPSIFGYLCHCLGVSRAHLEAILYFRERYDRDHLIRRKANDA